MLQFYLLQVQQSRPRKAGKEKSLSRSRTAFVKDSIVKSGQARKSPVRDGVKEARHSRRAQSLGRKRRDKHGEHNARLSRFLRLSSNSHDGRQGLCSGRAPIDAHPLMGIGSQPRGVGRAT
jgi:hypothetical protein